MRCIILSYCEEFCAGPASILAPPPVERSQTSDTAHYQSAGQQGTGVNRWSGRWWPGYGHQQHYTTTVTSNQVLIVLIILMVLLINDAASWQGEVISFTSSPEILQILFPPSSVRQISIKLIKGQFRNFLLSDKRR